MSHQSKQKAVAFSHEVGDLARRMREQADKMAEWAETLAREPEQFALNLGDQYSGAAYALQVRSLVQEFISVRPSGTASLERALTETLVAAQRESEQQAVRS